MFKNLMARFGMGAAKVDLVLDQSQYRLGETVEGKVVIKGGEVEQKINHIHVQLMLGVQHEGVVYKHLVTKIPISGTFTIHPKEVKELPFSYELPYDWLVSSQNISYSFITDLDIAGGVDHQDQDHVEILCPMPLQQVIDALGELGFYEKHESREFDGNVQEFEFAPTNFLSEAKELEFVAIVQPDHVRLLLELEFKQFGLEVERKREVLISDDLLSSPSELTAYLRQVLSEMASGEYSYTGTGSFSYKGSGAIGTFFAGAIAGLVVSEILDDMDDVIEDVIEEAFEDDDDEGGFFDED